MANAPLQLKKVTPGDVVAVPSGSVGFFAGSDGKFYAKDGSDAATVIGALDTEAAQELIDTSIESELRTQRLFWKDNGTEISHVYIDEDGIVDTQDVDWQVAIAPPVIKIPMPDYAGAATRNKVGPFSSGNQISVGTSFFNFPNSPWMAAVEIDHTGNDSGYIASCLGTFGNGWALQCASAGIIYILNGGFSGPQGVLPGGRLVQGRNTVIFGWDGTDLLLKVNGAKVQTLTAPYNVATGATGYIGSAASSQYYLGKIYEIAGWNVTPTAAMMDALFASSRKEQGASDRFPRDANTRFHFSAREYAANTWSYWPFDYTSRTPSTLTTTGTVAVTTEPVVRKQDDSRYVISPAANPATLTEDTSMYYLTGPNNVFNIGTSFHAAVAVIPDTVGLTTTQIYFASGKATAEGGWQLVNEDNDESPSSTLDTVWIGSNTKMNGPTLVGDKLNVIMFGWDAENGKGYLKVNDAPTQRRTMTVIQQVLSGVRRDQAQIAGHNDMDIGFTGAFVESIFRTGAPTDARFNSLLQEMLARDV